ncbi:MAG: serine/threonine-protein kinase, partial [Myxococcota bacterium]
MSAASLSIPRLTCLTCNAVFRGHYPRCPRDGSDLQSTQTDPLEGKPFADRYVIERCVGEGGMGRVYRARHQRVSRRFAIKVLFGDFATDTKMHMRFEREAEAASRLDHPNVVSVVDFGETESGQLYLVMDYAEGKTLADIISQGGPMNSERVAHLALQMAHGLAHAHEETRLVHRDFKSDNVIVVAKADGDELARILDFGLAIPQEPLDAAPRLTAAGLVMGTAEYMSPEQATGQVLDHRTDLFSFGVVLYEMLAGTLPFDGTPPEIIKANLTVDPPPIRTRVVGVDPDPVLEQIALWLMRKRPSERPQSAREVIAALQDQRFQTRVDPHPPLGMTASPLAVRHGGSMAGAELARPQTAGASLGGVQPGPGYMYHSGQPEQMALMHPVPARRSRLWIGLMGFVGAAVIGVLA